MLRVGFLLGFTAVLLQIAVFLQPLLPKQFQIAPVCETITRALFEHPYSTLNSALSQSHALHGTDHQHHSAQHHAQLQADAAHSDHNHHDVNHQCQYCTVFGNLVLPPELQVKEVLVRIQVRLLAFEKAFKHVYFQLQRLYLLPQGRAPPLFT